jgi:hypothetical protein
LSGANNWLNLLSGVLKHIYHHHEKRLLVELFRTSTIENLKAETNEPSLEHMYWFAITKQLEGLSNPAFDCGDRIYIIFVLSLYMLL